MPEDSVPLELDVPVEQKAKKRKPKIETAESAPAADASAAASTVSAARRGRSNRPFPAVPFTEAHEFAKQIYDFGSGQPVRRLSLFDHLQRTPDSGPSRQLITNANKYGLLKGSYASEHLELTQEASAGYTSRSVRTAIQH